MAKHVKYMSTSVLLLSSPVAKATMTTTTQNTHTQPKPNTTIPHSLSHSALARSQCVCSREKNIINSNSNYHKTILRR